MFTTSSCGTCSRSRSSAANALALSRAFLLAASAVVSLQELAGVSRLDPSTLRQVRRFVVWIDVEFLPHGFVQDRVFRNYAPRSQGYTPLRLLCDAVVVRVWEALQDPPRESQRVVRLLGRVRLDLRRRRHSWRRNPCKDLIGFQ